MTLYLCLSFSGVLRQPNLYTVLATLSVAEHRGNLAQGENSFRINTAMLVQGMYTLRVKTEDGVIATLRFVKE